MSQFTSFFSNTVAKWWSPRGLFLTTPDVTWVFRWEYVALIVICLLVGIAMFFLKIRPSLKGRIQSFAWANAIIGVILYFFRDQRIPFIGMDLLRFAQEVGMVFWINSIVLFSRKGLQEEILSEQVQARREKYLPKKSA